MVLARGGYGGRQPAADRPQTGVWPTVRGFSGLASPSLRSRRRPALLAPFRSHPGRRRALELFGGTTPAVAAVAGPTGVTTTLLAAADALAPPGPVLLVTAFEDQARAAYGGPPEPRRGRRRAARRGDGDTHLVGRVPSTSSGRGTCSGAGPRGPSRGGWCWPRRSTTPPAADAQDRPRTPAGGDGRVGGGAAPGGAVGATPWRARRAAAPRRRNRTRDRLEAPALHRAPAEGDEDGGGHCSTRTWIRPAGSGRSRRSRRTTTAGPPPRGRAAIVVTFENGRDRVDPLRRPADRRLGPAAGLAHARDARGDARAAAGVEPLPARPAARPTRRGARRRRGDRPRGRPARPTVRGRRRRSTPCELKERSRPARLRPRGRAPRGRGRGRPRAELPVPFSRNPDAAAQELAARGRRTAVLVVSDHPDDPRLKRPPRRRPRCPAAAGRALRGLPLEEQRRRHRGRSRPRAARRARPARGRRRGPAPDGPPETGTLGSVLVSLEPGDALVHADHGVALFGGMEPIETGIGSRRTTLDHLTLAFAEPDTLRVPADQAARVFPFHASADAPTPDPLNGLAWGKKLALAEAAANAFRAGAAESGGRGRGPVGAVASGRGRPAPRVRRRLPARADRRPVRGLRRRRRRPGGGDTDGPAGVRRRRLRQDRGRGPGDLPRGPPAARPRDGVARRGHQAVLLAATTVLAEQHGRSLAARLGPHGVSVGVLARLRSAEEQDALKAGLADGSLDLLIGTTAVLADAIRFDDLGLVVIDEEHRFGSGDKEALRSLRDGVDTLALTATPIPRTLHTALAGLRAVSTLRTPPAGRKPVVTEVLPAEDGRPRVRTALRRELARGGQAFVVHNRVDDLDEAAEEVRRTARRPPPARRDPPGCRLRPRPAPRGRAGGRAARLLRRGDGRAGVYDHRRERPGRGPRRHDRDRGSGVLRPRLAAPAPRARGPLGPARLLPAGGAPERAGSSEGRRSG